MDVPRYQKKRGDVKIIQGAIMPPHLVWKEVYRFDKDLFEDLFGERRHWVEWWRAHMNEPWLKEHPLRHLISEFPERCCPWLLFGDDSQTTKRVGRTMELLLWFSPVSRDRTTRARLPVFMKDNGECTARAMEMQLTKAAVWSWKQAELNIHPRCSEDGKQLPKYFAAHAGTPLIPDEPLYLVPSRAHVQFRPVIISILFLISWIKRLQVGLVERPSGLQRLHRRLEVQKRSLGLLAALCRQ